MTDEGVYVGRAILKARIAELEMQVEAQGLALRAVNAELMRLQKEGKDAEQDSRPGSR